MFLFCFSVTYTDKWMTATGPWEK